MRQWKKIHNANMKPLPILKCLELVTTLEQRPTPLLSVFWCNQFQTSKTAIVKDGAKNMKDSKNWDTMNFWKINLIYYLRKYTQRNLTLNPLTLSSLNLQELELFQSITISQLTRFKISFIKLTESIFQVIKSNLSKMQNLHTPEWSDKFWVTPKQSTKNKQSISQSSV